jgi:hypothetical protein
MLRICPKNDGLVLRNNTSPAARLRISLTFAPYLYLASDFAATKGNAMKAQRKMPIDISDSSKQVLPRKKITKSAQSSVVTLGDVQAVPVDSPAIALQNMLSASIAKDHNQNDKSTLPSAAKLGFILGSSVALWAVIIVSARAIANLFG